MRITLRIPINVNSKVCQLVDIDACYYDINKNKCENVNLQTANCDTLGLNPLGCIEIDYCVYQEYCQRVSKQFYYCHEYLIANYRVCMNAIDSCKFNELTSGCSQANQELCDAKGLSMQGCQSSKCTWINNQCKCNSIQEYDCNYISSVTQCNSLNLCIYDNPQNKCRWKQCEDQSAAYCDGQQIQQFYCYVDTSQLCKSAEQCEDIKSPQNKKCPQLHDKPCVFNSKLNQCQQLNCELLNEQQCLNQSNYCKFRQTCKFLGCNDMKQINCPSNRCNWDSGKNQCEDQVECSSISDQNKCIKQKYKNGECYWATLNQESFCTDKPCRYLTNTLQCNGFQINNEICVELTDNTCVSCEEISSPCICLQNNQYCAYSFTEMKCSSKICQLFTDQQNCPELYCVFNKKCKQKCEQIQQQSQCESNNCIWQDKQCQLSEETVQNIEEPTITVNVWELIGLGQLGVLILNL